MKNSGASNRQRSAEAAQRRSAEDLAETVRLANLSEEAAAQLRQVFDYLEWGVISEEGMRGRK